MLEERHAASALRIELEQTSWLAPSALALVGVIEGIGGRDSEASRLGRGEGLRLTSRWIGFGGESGDGAGRAGMLVVTLPQLDQVMPGESSLLADLEGAEVSLAVEDLSRSLADFHVIVRERFTPLGAKERERVVEFLAMISNTVPEAERHALSRRLFAIREQLRERPPAHVLAENRSFGLHADRISAVDDRSFYIEGWIHDENLEATRVTAVSPEGSRVELLERMFRYPRPDVAQLFPAHHERVQPNHGFVCFVELNAPSLLRDGWLLEMETVTGTAVEVPAPTVEVDPATVRDTILKDPFYERLPDDELMAKHVHPAISRIQRVEGMEAGFEEVVQFGTPPDSPVVSVVVPLYERLDHLEMQLAEFVHDPEISEADLIYVLDSPEQADELLELATQLTPLYRVPFRIGILERNVGFAGANNAGASLARGRLLLLLNSDILPDRPGWLSTMQLFYDSKPNIGALGPKLLYEDDSIQHAGMYYYQQPGSSIWTDAHYFKGMHRSLPAANAARSVSLVSGACLMIDRSLYEGLGGLHGIYVRGDYEDAELCLHLSEQGRENWYVPDVELYHLEGQSYTPSVRRAANRYNMWLHSHLWGDRIAALMKES